MSNEIQHLREIGKFRLDAERKVLSFQDKPIDIPLKEIELLCVLTENGGQLVTKEELLNRVWADSFVEESNLTRHIYLLRKMFAAYGESEDIIQNVPRRGYRFNAQIKKIAFAQTEDEFVLERHSKQQFIIEEIPQTLSLPKSRNLSKIFVPAIAFGSIVLLSAFAFWKINASRNQEPSIPLASMRIKQLITWDDEAGEGDNGAKISPAGAMIAYSMTKNGQRNIWTKQIPDGKPNPITDGKWNYFNPIWSPDGERLAFISNRDNQTAIWSMPFSGGELLPIKTLESDKVNLLSWSKDGTKIYFAQDFNVFSVTIDSKEINRLTDLNPTEKPQFFNLSPDETRVAYSSGSNEKLHIFVLTLNGGTSAQITNDNDASDEYPFWLPDGNRIIYSSKRGGIFQPSIAYLNKQRTEQINIDLNDTLISDVAADGDKILFSKSREESDLWQVNIDDNSETQITSESGLELWSDVSPDDKNIVMQTTTEAKHLLGGAIQIYSNDDRKQINLVNNGFLPTFSPDGQKIAFLRYADNLFNLWITEKDGTEKKLTTTGIRFSGFSMMPYNRVQVKDYDWSPDGNSLIYSAKSDNLWNIWQVTADGLSQPKQLSANLEQNLVFSSPMFSPDASQIAFVESHSDSKKTTSVHLLHDQIDEIIYSTDSAVKLIGWNEAGNKLIIAETKGNLTAKPTSVKLSEIGGKQTDIATIDAVYFNNIQLSPDKQNIAFATREDANDKMQILSVSNNAKPKIVSNLDQNTYISGITWAKNGKAIYYSRQKNVRLISMIENFK